MRTHDSTSSTLTLRQAIDFYPHGSWSTDEHGLKLWKSEEIITGGRSDHRTAPDVDLDQPVLFVGAAVYPAVPRKQEDVLPILTLVTQTTSPYNLDDSLLASHDLWLAPDGICWSADELRRSFTLGQRASEVWDQGTWEFQHRWGECGVVATRDGDVLFLRVRDLRHAQDAYISLKLSQVRTPAVVAAGDGARSSRAQATAIKHAVMALEYIDLSDLDAVGDVLGAPVYVRFAMRDDVPFWSPQDENTSQIVELSPRPPLVNNVYATRVPRRNAPDAWR